MKALSLVFALSLAARACAAGLAPRPPEPGRATSASTARALEASAPGRNPTMRAFLERRVTRAEALDQCRAAPHARPAPRPPSRRLLNDTDLTGDD